MPVLPARHVPKTSSPLTPQVPIHRTGLPTFDSVTDLVTGDRVEKRLVLVNLHSFCSGADGCVRVACPRRLTASQQGHPRNIYPSTTTTRLSIPTNSEEGATPSGSVCSARRQAGGSSSLLETPLVASLG